MHATPKQSHQFIISTNLSTLKHVLSTSALTLEQWAEEEGGATHLKNTDHF
jgi:hypothetical protein